MINDIGKISSDFFTNQIQLKLGAPNSQILVKPGIGLDVSVIDLEVQNLALIVTADPISFLPKIGPTESAILSLNYLINDMATSGFSPKFAQFVFNLSHQITTAEFQEYWTAIHNYSSQINLSITGGHTGFVENELSTTIGGGTFFTIADKSQILCSNLAQSTDAILMTKTSALAASFVLSKSFPNYIAKNTSSQIVDLCNKNIHFTSSLLEALFVKKHFPNDLHAMHDVTEGGILGAVYEMSIASQLNFELWEDKITLGQAESAICQLFNIDPIIVDGAGSMIMACNSLKVPEIIESLKSINIKCTEIGKFLPNSFGNKLISKDNLKNIESLPQDPYWQTYFKAVKQGWD
ncbi:MAG: AIR synthase-related protein [Sediminibacterium sp.]|nr:AIR synthase-related protein [Sediminibacterium sp.]